MPRDLFGDVVSPSVTVGARKWYTLPLSIAVHLVVVGAIVIMAFDVGWGGDDQKPCLSELSCHEARVLQSADAHGQIETVFSEIDVFIGQFQLNRNLRMEIHELENCGCDDRFAKGQRCCHTQRAFQAT